MNSPQRAVPVRDRFYARTFALLTALVLGIALFRIVQPFIGPGASLSQPRAPNGLLRFFGGSVPSRFACTRNNTFCANADAANISGNPGSIQSRVGHSPNTF